MSHRGGYSAARPKRAGETFARTHHQDGDEPDSKKPRFDARNPSILAPDAPEEDVVLEADVIGKGAATKRNAVNIDGYDSDSSNDNFNERADAKSKAEKEGKSKDEEEEDMFADLAEADGDEDEDLSREGKKKKKVKFLDVEEIDGAVSSSKSGGRVVINDVDQSANNRIVDAESSSDSGSDEERDRLPNNIDEELGAGHKKKHAPKLDAFNMRAEGEEGRFDENGNFVRKAADPDAIHDTWLEGISRKEMKRAADAHAKREEEERQRRLADDEVLTSDLLKLLIQNLQLGETPLEALQRHNKGRKQLVPKWKQKKIQQNGKAMEVDPAEDAVEKQKKQAIEDITDASTKLMNRGTDDIYEQERELLMRWYKRETGEDWVDTKVNGVAEDNSQYEFRYSLDPTLTPNGPYDKQTLQSWVESGQFAAAVQFKRVGGTDWSETIDDD